MPTDLTRLRVAVIGIAATAALGLAVISVWHQLHQPVIVTVDIIGLADEARINLRDSASMGIYAQRIERELRSMASEENLVILPRQAVAAGAPDITDRLRKRLRP